MTIKRADWVRSIGGHLGFVVRASKDGTWADVRWRSGDEEWVKRMPTSCLTVEHTIPVYFGDGLIGTVTDWSRKQELEG